MGFNKFTLNIILRSVLLAINSLLIAFLAANSEWVFTFIFLCLLFIFQVYMLIRYSTKINRDLANFLIHIKEQNTTLAFSKNNLDKTFSGLTKQFENINNRLSEIKDQEIKRQNFLNLILNRVGTGILVINNNQEIVLHNMALLNLFEIYENTNSKLILERINSSINEFANLQPGEQKITTIHVSNLTRRILISYSEIKEKNELQKIYSFHDIDREMTDYELQSWNGLIKVFSHEIMNTITPLTTVINTLSECLTINGIEKEINNLDIKDISDSVKGIKLIENRITSLKNFIVKFRQFSDIPMPEPAKINVNSFLENIIEIYRSNFPAIQFINNPTSNPLAIFADEALLELVINNIIKNAIESLFKSDTPKIVFTNYLVNKHVVIEICDNGHGIDSSIIKKVFIPFFTTKKEGSGIGLALAQQIMFSNKGNIVIDSGTHGTCVKLLFNSTN